MPEPTGPSLPIVEELGAQLYAAASTRSRRWLGRRPRSPRRARWLPVALFVLVGASATMGGLAAAGTLGGGTIGPQAWVDGQRVQPEAAPTPDETQLAILRRPRTAADALDAYDSQVFTNTPAAGDGVNVDLSRRVSGVSSGAAWVVPGNGGTICLVAENAQGLEMNSEPGPWDHHTRVPGANGSTACTTIEAIDAGWIAGYGFTSQTPGMSFTGGIVPDGVATVTVALSGGTQVTEVVHDNTWFAEVAGTPVSVSFTGPDGPVTSSSP
jgi:hypothetical protein